MLHEKIDKFECKTEVGHFRGREQYEIGPIRVECCSAYMKVENGGMGVERGSASTSCLRNDSLGANEKGAQKRK